LNEAAKLRGFIQLKLKMGGKRLEKTIRQVDFAKYSKFVNFLNEFGTFFSLFLNIFGLKYFLG